MQKKRVSHHVNVMLKLSRVHQLNVMPIFSSYHQLNLKHTMIHALISCDARLLPSLSLPAATAINASSVYQPLIGL